MRNVFTHVDGFTCVFLKNVICSITSDPYVDRECSAGVRNDMYLIKIVKVLKPFREVYFVKTFGTFLRHLDNVSYKIYILCALWYVYSYWEVSVNTYVVLVLEFCLCFLSS